MTDAAAQFAEFVQVAGLDPSVVPEVEIKPVEQAGSFGMGTYLRQGESVTIPGHGVAAFHGLRSGCVPLLELPSGYLQCGVWSVPASEPDLTPVPESATEYWRRRAILAHKIASADGRLQVSGGNENGWLPILERMIDAILRVMAPTDAVEVAATESCGCLHVPMRALGDDIGRSHFIRSVGDWARAVSVHRCVVFGTPGWYGPVDNSWSFILSDRARSIEASELVHHIYPRPPGPALGFGDA
jgi:hypothetical protein